MTWFRHLGDSKFHLGAPDLGSFCTLCNGRWPVEDERRGEVEHDESPLADERCTVCMIADLRAQLDGARRSLRAARRAIRGALGAWCPRDPGGDGADGETYRLCIEALEVRE